MSKLAIELLEGTAHTLRVYSETASPVPFTADLPPGGIPSILICMSCADRCPWNLGYEANKYADACLDFRMEPIDFLQIKLGGASIIHRSKVQPITLCRSFHRSQRWWRRLKQPRRLLFHGQISSESAQGSDHYTSRW